MRTNHPPNSRDTLSVHIRTLPASAPVDSACLNDDSYLVLEGSAVLIGTNSHGKRITLSNFKKGDLIQTELRNTSIVTLEPSRFLVLPKNELKLGGEGETLFTSAVIERLAGVIQARTNEIAELHKQGNAVNELLGTLSRAPSNLQRVLNNVVEYAAILCDSTDAGIMKVDGDELRMVARYGPTPILPVGSILKKTRYLASGRSVIDCIPIHVPDILAAEDEFPEGAAISKQNGIRTVFAAPLVREATAVGTIFIWRREVRPLSDMQIQLIVAFAHQATIAIETVRLMNETQEKSHQLKHQAEQLAEWNSALESRVAEQVSQIERLTRLEHELELAGRIQTGMLPRTIPDLEGFQLGARMVPAKLVGGDFFDFIPLGDDVLAIAVGDVSDKGIPAALFMAMVRSLLRAEAHVRQSPGQILRRVNRHLLEMNDNEMFVTVLLGVLNRATCVFHYARAGHESPVFLDASGVINRSPHSHGQALGVFEEVALEEQTVTLFRGSLMLLYSDGITDAIDQRNDRFGAERIRSLLRQSRYLSAQQICDKILSAAKQHQGDRTSQDDMTILVAKAV